MGKGPLIVGGMLGLGALGWALVRPAAATPMGPRSIVTTEIKVRRGWRVRWRGAGTPPAGLAPVPPRFKVGDKAVIRNPGEKDVAVEGKAVTVMEVIYSERVAYGAGGVVTVLPEPGAWSYRTDLEVGGQPVEVAEPALQKA